MGFFIPSNILIYGLGGWWTLWIHMKFRACRCFLCRRLSEDKANICFSKSYGSQIMKHHSLKKNLLKKKKKKEFANHQARLLGGHIKCLSWQIATNKERYVLDNILKLMSNSSRVCWCCDNVENALILSRHIFKCFYV